MTFQAAISRWMQCRCFSVSVGWKVVLTPLTLGVNKHFWVKKPLCLGHLKMGNFIWYLVVYSSCVIFLWNPFEKSLLERRVHSRTQYRKCGVFLRLKSQMNEDFPKILMTSEEWRWWYLRIYNSKVLRWHFITSRLTIKTWTCSFCIWFQKSWSNLLDMQIQFDVWFFQ